MKLKDKIAVVTGGGSGIGREISLLFAEEGARVAVNDLTLESAQRTVEAMGAAKPRGFAVEADVSDSARVREMFAEVEKRFGGIDILVNNAGIGEATPDEMETLNKKAEARAAEVLGGQPIETHWDITQEMTDEAWLKMIGVHLNGTFFCTREALKRMSRKNSGVIINMSSIAGLTGLDPVPHYCAAKGGILGFTRSVAREVGSRNIRVNAICPGFIQTPMTDPISPVMKMMVLAQTPLQRWAQPQEVAATALFLASDDSAFFTGQWLSPNGGVFIG
jgi:3-oxoacyl-[acyl-carrier protein] reductase